MEPFWQDNVEAVSLSSHIVLCNHTKVGWRLPCYVNPWSFDLGHLNNKTLWYTEAATRTWLTSCSKGLRFYSHLEIMCLPAKWLPADSVTAGFRHPQVDTLQCHENSFSKHAAQEICTCPALQLYWWAQFGLHQCHLKRWTLWPKCDSNKLSCCNVPPRDCFLMSLNVCYTRIDTQLSDNVSARNT